MKYPARFAPLSFVQIKGLQAMASVAWKKSKERGAIDEDESREVFRHREQLAKTGHESLKTMTQEHYRMLKGHWLYLIGLLGPAFDLLVRTGEGQEERDLMQHLVSEATANLAIAFQIVDKQSVEESIEGAWRYVLHLARDKFQGRDLKSLSPDELKQLRDTIINRTTAKHGKGNPANRNKKQREKKPDPPVRAPTAEDALHPWSRRAVPVAHQTAP